MSAVKRVLMAAINADHKQAGMFYGFEKVFGLGNVRDYDFLELQRRGVPGAKINDGLVAAAIEHKVDWVWLQIQETNVLDASVVGRIKEKLPRCVISHWTGDLRPRVSDNMRAFSKVTDHTFISSIGQIPLFREAGARSVHYCQIGLDFQEDVQGLPAWTPPFRVPEAVFCGNWYGDTFPGSKDRMAAINALKAAGVDVGVVGNGWPQGTPRIGSCSVKSQQHHVYKRAKVCLSVSNFNTINGYYSDRFLIGLASGTPVVAIHSPGIEDEFTNGVDCLLYKSTGELVEHVKRLLADPGLRAKIGAAGREEVINRHTWEARFRAILPIIEGARA